LFADDFESLIEDFSGIPICAAPDSQVDYALLFRLQIDRHVLTLISTPRTVKRGVSPVHQAFIPCHRPTSRLQLEPETGRPSRSSRG